MAKAHDFLGDEPPDDEPPEEVVPPLVHEPGIQVPDIWPLIFDDQDRIRDRPDIRPGEPGKEADPVIPPDFGPIPVIPPGRKPGPFPLREPVPDTPGSPPLPLPEAAIEFDDPLDDLFRRMQSPKSKGTPTTNPGAWPGNQVLPPLQLGERTKLGQRARMGNPLLGLTSRQLGTSEGVLAWALRQYAAALKASGERGAITSRPPRTTSRSMPTDFVASFINKYSLWGAVALAGGALAAGGGGIGFFANWTDIINSMTGRRAIVSPRKGPGTANKRGSIQPTGGAVDQRAVEDGLI